MGKPDVDKKLIRELAELLDETGLTEIEIEEDDRRIRISRQATAAAVAAPAPVIAAAPAVAPAGAAAPAGDDASHPGAVTSPMVGTAYRAPEPSAAPFVNVGDKVSAGQTVMIIEAMKTFNEIPAPHGGTVKKILVDSGTPVEFGDVLLIVE
jgi:acetyl-CoA carboxylase biotin carboxyl carrier protein